MNKYNRAWWRRILANYRACQQDLDSYHYYSVTRGELIRAFFALLFDRGIDDFDWQHEGYTHEGALASVGTGTYMTDYGEGYSFEEFHLVGWRFGITADGTL